MDLKQFANQVKFLSDQRASKEAFRDYLPRSGVGFRSCLEDDFKRYGYMGSFRNYADLTGYVVILDDYPDNVFFLRQSIEKREFLPIVMANHKARPSHADFVTVAAKMFAFTDAGYGSSICMPVASYYCPPLANKAPAYNPALLHDEQAKVEAIRNTILHKRGSWNYVQLAGIVVRRELVNDPKSDVPLLTITIAQHDFVDSHINVVYSGRDAGMIKQNCPVDSFVSIRGEYATKPSAKTLVPFIRATGIRAASKHDAQFGFENGAWRMPNWVKRAV